MGAREVALRRAEPTLEDEGLRALATEEAGGK